MRARRQLRTWGRVGVLAVAVAAFLVPASPAQAAGTVTADKTAIDFGNQRVGTFGEFETVTFTFTGDPVTVTAVEVKNGETNDFVGGTDCLTSNDGPKTFTAGDTCKVSLVFLALDRGERSAELHLMSDASDSPEVVALSGTGTVGYYLAGAAGQVAGFGDAEDFGDMSDADLNDPIINMATVPNGDGYWLLGEDGGVFAFGMAEFYGSMGGIPLNEPIVGIASTPTGEGYWLVALDGGVFAFGDAQFYGSMGGRPLNQPIVGMASTPTGEGYWLVALDGGIFAFGDAGFFGSMGGKPLNEPIVGMAPSPSGEGYHNVALDGGMFQFGDAKFFGSMGGRPLNLPMIGMAMYPTGEGYWTVAIDGGIFAFGDAPFMGSLGGQGVNDVIGMASTSPPVDMEAVMAASSSGSGRSLGAAAPNLPDHRKHVD
ncbi:MAG: hypothetical protein KY443_11460 [Actinobacteria bacterium]|nr:hypothetical protein [Actinomycetota bacterium]